MTLTQTHTFELSGRQFTLNKLSFRKALPVYCKFQKLMAAFFDDDAMTDAGLAIFQIAGFAGQVSHADLTEYITAFGPSTVVDFGDGRVQVLQVKPATKTSAEVDPVAELFDDNLPDLFRWLDECIKFNFAETIAKTASALKASGSAPGPKATPGE